VAMLGAVAGCVHYADVSGCSVYSVGLGEPSVQEFQEWAKECEDERNRVAPAPTPTPMPMR
jgi:hypothetical protein